MNSEKKINLPHINSISIEKKGLFKKHVYLNLSGTLPSPAYEITDIQFKVEKDTLTVTPVLSHDPHKVVIQISIFFERKIELTERVRNKTISTIRVTSDKGQMTTEL